MKCSIKDFFSKCDEIHRKLKETLNGKLHFLCNEKSNFLLCRGVFGTVKHP